MGFKLNGAPYTESDMNIPVYRKNIQDGAVGKSNHTGIIVQEGLPKEVEDAVVAHETVHQLDPHLDYDENNFYYKGKTYPRENLNEFDKNLPWEKKAYAESDKILNNKQHDMKEGFSMKGHRGNNKPFAAMGDKGLIAPSMNYTVSGGEETKDPDIKSKEKIKTKRFGKDKGTVITKTKYVNTKTGEKGGSIKKVKPNTLSGHVAAENMLNVVTGGIAKITTTPGSESKTPGSTTPPSTVPNPPDKKPADPKETLPTKGGTVPDNDDGKDVPTAKKGQKQYTGTPSSWLEKMSTTYPGSSGEELADKGHIGKGHIDNYNATYYKPKKEVILPMTKIEAKPINIVRPQRALTIQAEKTGGITEESWKKRKGKKKEKNPPTKPPKNPPPPPLQSTEFSNKCTKAGKCGPGQLYASGMFGSPTGKEIRQMNKQQRSYNKSSRQAFRESMKPVRQQKREAKLRQIGKMFKKDTSYQGNLKRNSGKNMVPLKVRLFGYRG